jgi:hypothetical protein
MDDDDPNVRPAPKLVGYLCGVPVWEDARCEPGRVYVLNAKNCQVKGFEMKAEWHKPIA